MLLLLTVLTALAVLILFGALAYYVQRIVNTLEAIGRPRDSDLSRIGYGVRAIEHETGHLAPQVTQLNQALAAVTERLARANRDLAPVVEALESRQGGQR